jgi:hypothetical protein
VKAVTRIRKGATSQKNARDLQIYIKLTIFFVVGIILGCVAAGKIDLALTGTAKLEEYFYNAVSGRAPKPDVYDVLFRTYVFPCLILLCGYMTFGGLLLPLLVGGRSFQISYIISFLVMRHGRSGLLFACLAVLPTQIIAVPCLLRISCACSRSSSALMCFSFGRIPDAFPVYDKPFYIDVISGLLMLVFPFAIETFLIPELFPLCM